MAVIGELAVNVVARTSGLSAGMNRARKQMGLLSSAALGVRRSLLALGAAFTAFRGIGFIASVTAEAETAKATFEVLTGSMQEGVRVYEELRQLAAGTPLQLTQLSKSARTLMLFGATAENVTDTLRRLGDVSGGNATNLQFMSRAFGQITSLGRLQAQDLMQLVNAGWNPLNEIMEKTGESMEEVRERMKNGEVSAEEVSEALVKATSVGGRFYGMMEKMSKTLEGRWSTLKDQVSQVALQFGEILMPLFEGVISKLQDIVMWIHGLSPGMKRFLVIATAVGTVVAGMVATVWAIHKAWMAVLLVKEALFAIEAALSVLNGKWINVGLAVATVATVTGAVLAVNANLGREIDNNTRKQRKFNQELERTNSLSGVGASGVVSYQGGSLRNSNLTPGMRESLELRMGITSRPVTAKLDPDSTRAITDGLSEVKDAVEKNTDETKGGGVGMAAGL